MDKLNEQNNIEQLKNIIIIYYQRHLQCLLSSKVALTLASLFEAFTQLVQKSSINQITVTHLITKSGYSRTTFYKYFDSLPDLIREFQSIILFPLDYYSKEYYAFFTQTSFKAFNRINIDAVIMMRYFRIFINDEHFMKKYRQAIFQIFNKYAPTVQTATDDQQQIFNYSKECILSYCSDAVLYYYRHTKEITLAKHLQIVHIISHKLMEALQQIHFDQINN